MHRKTHLDEPRTGSLWQWSQTGGRDRIGPWSLLTPAPWLAGTGVDHLRLARPWSARCRRLAGQSEPAVETGSRSPCNYLPRTSFCSVTSSGLTCDLMSRLKSVQGESIF